MRLKQRLERLEDVFKIHDDPESEAKKTGEYVRAWMDEPEGRELFKQFEDYCRKSGVPYDPKTRWVELTRTDPIAEELARKYLESYRNYVKIHFGVIYDEVDSAFTEA